MKYIKTALCFCLVLLLASCSSGVKSFEEGMAYLDIKDYIAAEEAFEKAIGAGYDKENINVIYTIVSAYNNAKECYDVGDYDKMKEYINKIPHAYSDYVIGIDVDLLKEQLEKIEEISRSISKARNLLDAGEYEDANAIILMLDTENATEKQLTEAQELKSQIKLEKKNNDYEVLRKIDRLVESYVYGLCEAVNTGDFRPLKGSLYEGSSIYKTQTSYIANMAHEDIYEYIQDYKVNSVEWTSETSCVISTSETYTIYDGGNSRTQTFRYTYDVIETSDKQLFLTSITKSH